MMMEYTRYRAKHNPDGSFCREQPSVNGWMIEFREDGRWHVVAPSPCVSGRHYKDLRNALQYARKAPPPELGQKGLAFRIARSKQFRHLNGLVWWITVVGDGGEAPWLVEETYSDGPYSGGTHSVNSAHSTLGDALQFVEGWGKLNGEVVEMRFLAQLAD